MAQERISLWSVDDVRHWLCENNLSECCGAFFKHEIDGDILLTMSEDDLAKLGIEKFRLIRTFGRAVKVLRERATFQNASQIYKEEPPPPFSVEENGKSSNIKGAAISEKFENLLPKTDTFVAKELEEVKFAVEASTDLKAPIIDENISDECTTKKCSSVQAEIVKSEDSRKTTIVEANTSSSDSSILHSSAAESEKSKKSADANVVGNEQAVRASNFDCFANYLEREHDRESALKELEIKAEKYKNGCYTSDMEAFLDGVPGFDEYDDSDDDEEDLQLPTKSLRTVKYEASLKAKGKYPPPEAHHMPTVFDPELTYKGVDGETYVQFYPKQAKPPKERVMASIVDVQNARQVYVHIDSHITFLEFMDPHLQQLHSDDGMPLPEDKVSPKIACAYKDVDSGRWFRCVINEVCSGEVAVTMVDYGRFLVVPRSSLKALRAHQFLKYEAQVYLCKIRYLCEPKPTQMEISLLKDMLDEEKQFECSFERNLEPYRITLIMRGGADFGDEFNKRLRQARGLFDQSLEQRRNGCAVETYRPSPFNRQTFGELTNKVGGSWSSVPSRVDFPLPPPPVEAVAVKPVTNGHLPTVSQWKVKEENVKPFMKEIDLRAAFYDYDDDVRETTLESEEDRDERLSIEQMDEDTLKKVQDWVMNVVPTRMEDVDLYAHVTEPSTSRVPDNFANNAGYCRSKLQSRYNNHR